MNKKTEFVTFLLISPNKFSISVLNFFSYKEDYFEEKLFEKSIDLYDPQILNEFLEMNIFKIEKKIQSFVKEIIIILDSKDFFEINFSTKNKNFDNNLNIDSLTLLLNDARYQCRQTYKDKKIIHMIINNYIIDNKLYSSMPVNVDCKDLSLELRFICLSNKVEKYFEESLIKYQISISKFISARYLSEIFPHQEKNIFWYAKDLMDGFNKNEVILINKSLKNEGFFEKFFNFFN